MGQRDDLVLGIRTASGGNDLARAVAALDAYDRDRAAQAAMDRELDLGARMVAARMTPALPHELHTGATDWLAEFDPEPRDFRTAMISEASAWYRSLPAGVRADAAETAEQARGMAHALGSAYGPAAAAARSEFLQAVAYLRSREGASGLPQIDQLIDPNNQPSATPYPTEVFDNFAPEQDPFNAGVESPDHSSGASSEGAPMLQQLQQQNGSGPGFGSGPEKPDEHDTGFDTANSYAEVPLGAPGTIPTSPPPTAGEHPQGTSSPNPVAGTNQDAGADRRQASRTEDEADRQDPEGCSCCQSRSPGGAPNDECPRCDHLNKHHRGRTAALTAAYTAPDPHGYRWVAGGAEVMHPFHERCGAAHWPDENCGSAIAHVASVAVDYGMNLEQAYRIDAAEHLGAREGAHAIQASASVPQLAAAHNRFTAAWGASERTAEDTAVLRGFQAVVRPVLAKEWNQAQREKARAEGNTLPGTTKLPIETRGDLADAERLKGKVKGASEEKIDAYLDRERERLGAAASRLDFPEAPSGEHRLASSDGGTGVSPDTNRCPTCGHTPGQDCGDSCCDTAYMATRPQVPLRPRQSASSLPQIQQTVDGTTNAATPQADKLPDGVMFPLNEPWQAQWETGPDGARPKGGGTQPGPARKEAAGRSRMNGVPSATAELFGHMDALEGRNPQHKDRFAFSTKAHGKYLQAWNRNAGAMHALSGKDPLSRESYGQMTGRPDLHGHYMESYEQAQTLRPWDRTGSRRTADTLTTPHRTTDDFAPPYSSPETTPQPFSSNTDPQDGDYQAGKRDGAEDRAAGRKPTFSDASSGVSPYVRGYSESFGQAGSPAAAQDVPASAGGDSGQAANAQEAATAFQVARASRTASTNIGRCQHGQCGEDGQEIVNGAMLCRDHARERRADQKTSAAFVPPAVRGDPDFIKGYRFTSVWNRGLPMVKQGSAAFEAGLYAGVTDRPEIQDAFLAAHAMYADGYPELARRAALHRQFTSRTAVQAAGVLVADGAYLRRVTADDDEPTVSELQEAQMAGLMRDGEHLSEISRDRARELVRQLRQQRTAGTTTDLITDGPGTSPDPLGATPLNGPGTPPPMGGRDDAGKQGGAPPYQGAPPLPGGPVVPNDVMGPSQEPAKPGGPFTQTFSGQHPENATLAPVAPNTANEAGYSNQDAYQGDRGPDKVAAFRGRVQSSLAAMAAGTNGSSQ